MSDPRSYDLAETFLILDRAHHATAKALSPSFFADLDREFDGFEGHLLISTFAFDADWPTWEIHPDGDEFVYLLEGDTDFVMRTDAGDRIVRVDVPGRYVVVPANTWHTARPHAPTRMLFVTPGRGTENRVTPGA